MEVIIGIKPDPGDHESNFKKVGSIPFGFTTMGTLITTPIYLVYQKALIQTFNTSCWLLNNPREFTTRKAKSYPHKKIILNLKFELIEFTKPTLSLKYIHSVLLDYQYIINIPI